MKICPVCNGQCDNAARFCPRDGTPLPEQPDPYLGNVLMGQFEVLEHCGQGATGTVYRAEQALMDRIVAIKFLKPELSRNPKVVKRFHREAKAIARLAHPNIITVHLVGETVEGVPYLVMEYVEGDDLDSICKKDAPMEIGRVFRISIQIAEALAEAHAHDIVHRDLKPANIIIFPRRGCPDFVKVLDFGIAKILQDGQDKESRLTKTGTIFGTPYYLAPEQASGDEVDYRADIYSLGVILFQMSTGRLPFESGSGLQVLVQHIKEPPPVPSSLRSDLPLELEEMILKALSKKKNDRYGSADQMLSELKRLEQKLCYGVGKPQVDVGARSVKDTVFTGPPEMGTKHAIEETEKRSTQDYGVIKAPQEIARPAVAEKRTFFGLGPSEKPACVTEKADQGVQFDAPATDHASGRRTAPPDFMPDGIKPAPPPYIPSKDQDRYFKGNRDPVAASPVPPPSAAVALPAETPSGSGAERSQAKAAHASAPVPEPAPSSSDDRSLLAAERYDSLSSGIKPSRSSRVKGTIFLVSMVTLALCALGIGAYFVLQDRNKDNDKSAKTREGKEEPEVGATKHSVDAGSAAARPGVTGRMRGLTLPEGETNAALRLPGVEVRISFAAAPLQGERARVTLDVRRRGKVDHPLKDGDVLLLAADPDGKAMELPVSAGSDQDQWVVSFELPRQKVLRLNVRVNLGSSWEAGFFAVPLGRSPAGPDKQSRAHGRRRTRDRHSTGMDGTAAPGLPPPPDSRPRPRPRHRPRPRPRPRHMGAIDGLPPLPD